MFYIRIKNRACKCFLFDYFGPQDKNNKFNLSLVLDKHEICSFKVNMSKTLVIILKLKHRDSWAGSSGRRGKHCVLV